MKNLISLRTFGFMTLLICAMMPAYIGWRNEWSIPTIIEIYVFVFTTLIYLTMFFCIVVIAIRTIIKYIIVTEYEEAVRRGKISYMKLDNVNRLFWVYEKLKGNTYVDRCVKKMNDMENFGEEI